MGVISLTADLGDFRAALRKVKVATKKAEADIVNGALKDVAFRAASFTPKTSQARVVSQLTSDGLLPALASMSLNKRVGKNTKTAKVWGRPQHHAEMLRILAARRRGVNAIRAGWIPAIQSLGGSFRGVKVIPGGSAAQGTAKPATIDNLSGFIVNTVKTMSGSHIVYTADEIAVALAALEKAIVFVTKDKNDYAQRKIDAILTAHSD